MEQLKNLKFLMFENETNICWLDASIALVVHNKTFKKIVNNCPESQINKIISNFDEAIAVLNNSDYDVGHRLTKTREMLLAIQNSTLEHLKQFLKFKPGEPDSAFCALLNLIYQDKSNIKECLNASWIWRKRCSNCGVNLKTATCTKPIITLSKVSCFHPESPSSIFMCSCKTEQEMKLIYKELPPCLIFHFEKGAGVGNNFPYSFVVKNREYQLTGIVMLEKGSDPNLNHFVTYIRDPLYNMWLECNDLNVTIISFLPVKPEFNFKDIYMCVYEAFDNLDKINNEVSNDQEQVTENYNIDVIDLSDEADDTKLTNSDCETKSSEVIKSEEKAESNFSQNYSDETKEEHLLSSRREKICFTISSVKKCINQNFRETGKSCNKNSQNICDSQAVCSDKTARNKHENGTKSKYFSNQEKTNVKVPDFEEKTARTKATNIDDNEMQVQSKENGKTVSPFSDCADKNVGENNATRKEPPLKNILTGSSISTDYRNKEENMSNLQAEKKDILSLKSVRKPSFDSSDLTKNELPSRKESAQKNVSNHISPISKTKLKTPGKNKGTSKLQAEQSDVLSKEIRRKNSFISDSPTANTTASDVPFEESSNKKASRQTNFHSKTSFAAHRKKKENVNSDKLQSEKQAASSMEDDGKVPSNLHSSIRNAASNDDIIHKGSHKKISNRPSCSQSTLDKETGEKLRALISDEVDRTLASFITVVSHIKENRMERESKTETQ